MQGKSPETLADRTMLQIELGMFIRKHQPLPFETPSKSFLYTHQGFPAL